MRVTLDHNFDVGLREIEDFFERDVPFAVSTAVKDTTFRVRQHIVERTYPASFRVRNARFPGVMFRVDQAASSGQAFRDFKSGMRGGIESRVYQRDMPSRGGGSPLREYMSTQARGGIKQSRQGHEVAIPVEKNIRRNSGGGVRKSDKPVQIRNKKKGAVIKGKGGVRLIVERGKKDSLTTKFILKNSAKIPKRFPFYEQARTVALQEIESAVYFAMLRAARSNRKLRMR